MAIGSTILGLAAVVVLRPSGVLVSSGLDPRRLELLRASVFGGVLPTRIETAARRLVPVEVGAGQRVIEQGDVADRVYIINSGTFDVSQRTPDGASVGAPDDGPGRGLRGDRDPVVDPADRDGHGGVGRAACSPWTATGSSVSSTPGRA